MSNHVARLFPSLWCKSTIARIFINARDVTKARSREAAKILEMSKRRFRNNPSNTSIVFSVIVHMRSATFEISRFNYHNV